MGYSDKLTNLLNGFKDSVPGGADSVAYNLVLDAITRSPSLNFLLENSVASGSLLKLKVLVTERSDLLGFYWSGDNSITFPVKASGEMSYTMPTLPFVDVFAHEVQHALNRSSSVTSLDTFRSGVDELASKPGMQEYTNLILLRNNYNAMNEAQAEIAGWNAVANSVHLEKDNPNYSDYLLATGGLSASIMLPDGTPVKGLTFNPDYSVNLSPENVAAVMASYFYNPAVRVSYGMTYPESYGADALKYIFQKNGGKEIAVDMATLNIDPVKLQQLNVFGLKAGDVSKVWDPVALKGYDYSGTPTGVVREERQPMAAPQGEKFEFQRFDESGTLVGTGHTWTNADGTKGDDFKTTSGDFESHWNELDGKQFYKHVSPDGGTAVSWTSDDGSRYSREDYATGKIKIKSYDAASGEDYSSIVNPDGTYSKWTNYANGAIHMENKLPSYLVITDEYEDGSETYFTTYSDGTTEKEFDAVDGSVDILTSYADGTTVHEFDAADGSVDTVTTNADGVRRVWTDASDGSGTEFTDKEGNFTHEFTDADGTKQKSYKNVDGSYGESEKHTDGLSHSLSVDKDGTKVTIDIDQQGTVTSKTEKAGGDVYLDVTKNDRLEKHEETYANGNYWKTYRKADGSYESYSKYGNVLTHTWTSENKNYEEVKDGSGDTTTKVTDAGMNLISEDRIDASGTHFHYEKTADGYVKSYVTLNGGTMTATVGNGGIDSLRQDADGTTDHVYKPSGGTWSEDTHIPNNVDVTVRQQQDGSEITEASFVGGRHESSVVRADGSMTWGFTDSHVHGTLQISASGEITGKVERDNASTQVFSISKSGEISWTTTASDWSDIATGNIHGSVHATHVNYDSTGTVVARTESDLSGTSISLPLPMPLELIGQQPMLKFPIYF